MQPQSDAEYKELLTEVIKKQIVILGPDITLIKARNVPGLTVSDDGTVTAITGEPQQITQSLIDQFVQLSGLIVKKTMEPLLMYRPPVDAPIRQMPQPNVTQQPSQVTSMPQQQTITPQPTPPMPIGTQPVSQIPETSPTQPAISADGQVTVTSQTAENEIDMDTQKIINDALKQT